MIGVLVSGNGTNLQALIDAGLPIAAVASNRNNAYALVRAREAGLPTATFSLDCHADRQERDLVLATWLEEHGVDLVVLAGYMHLLTKPFLDRFPERVVNVHPSLLPAFPGAHAIDDALTAGVETTGVTVHFVDEGLDTGPVLRQEAVAVEPRDTLAERIHAVEHRLLPEVVSELAARSGPPLGARGRRAQYGYTGPESIVPPAGEGTGGAGLRPAGAGAGRGLRTRALLSVYDKTGLDEFARGLAGLGWSLVSSGGTATRLAELGLDVTTVEDVTGAPEMLGGRVKTLHPRIHAGILARRDVPEDLETLAAQEIETFELVCVNLYPFTSVAAKRGVPEAEVVEMIDVGGPSMLRAAAKNFAHVAVVTSPHQYERVLELLRGDALDLDARRDLARDAFAASAAYEAAIATWFAETDRFPQRLTLSLEKVTDLSYGENPHQSAAYYREAGARRDLLSRVEQLGGKELSYNNLADLEGARRVSREFELPAAVIVKHANPCGVAVAGTIEEAWERALAADPVSAFGCVAILNRPVDAAFGRRLAEHFAEVLLAPGYDEEALDALRTKKNLRILRSDERRGETPGERDYKRVLGGLLVQDRDADVDDRESMEVACGTLTEEQWGDLLFAWRVCKHVSSNAIVLAKGLQTIGVGAGQMSRVDSVRIAVEKAREHGHELAGAVLASDAFFPFADGPQLALAAGITALIQPGGSRRDSEVLEAVQAAGAAMVLTGRRHFRH